MAYSDQASSASQGGHMAIPGPKDPDAIKLFLGLIPKHLDEAMLRPIFEPYGEIYDLSILRDRVTGISKGCGFLTYRYRQSAVDCMTAMNEKQMLPGGTVPIQVRVADSENKGDDRKLFVGMLSYSASEDYLRGLFSRFGTVEDCLILRNVDGTSKGCGFVKFSTRFEAETAIEGLNGKMSMDGAKMPIQVKFADTDKDKQQKKMQQGLGVGMGINPLAAAALLSMNPALLQQMQAFPQFQGMYGYGQGQQQQQQYAQQYGQQQYAQQQYAPQQYGQHYAPQPDLAAAYSGVQQFNSSQYAQSPYAQQNSFGVAKRTQGFGPDGANLFILNLPPDANDDTLRQLFSAFGNILSTNVFHDKITKISKQFGFVSYDNAVSASQAIAAMHGYNMSGYMLKVSLKKNTPY